MRRIAVPERKEPVLRRLPRPVGPPAAQAEQGARRGAAVALLRAPRKQRRDRRPAVAGRPERRNCRAGPRIAVPEREEPAFADRARRIRLPAAEAEQRVRRRAAVALLRAPREKRRDRRPVRALRPERRDERVARLVAGRLAVVVQREDGVIGAAGGGVAPEDGKHAVVARGAVELRQRPEHVDLVVGGILVLAVHREQRTEGGAVVGELAQRPQHRERRGAVVRQRPEVDAVLGRALALVVVALVERRALHGRGAAPGGKERRAQKERTDEESTGKRS